MHICVGKITNIDSDNGLSPGRHQAVIWTNAGVLLNRPLGTNFSEVLIKIHTFSFKKIHLKMSSGKWRPCFLGLNVLNISVMGTVLPNLLVYLSTNLALNQINSCCVIGTGCRFSDIYSDSRCTVMKPSRYTKYLYKCQICFESHIRR